MRWVMMTNPRTLLAMISAAACIPGGAAPILDNNVRQVEVRDAPSGESDLQAILDELFLDPGWGNVIDSQSTAGLFAAATGSATSIPTLYWEATANHLTNRFGMWFGSDASNLLYVPLFFGSADDGGAGGEAWDESSRATAAIQINPGVIEIGSTSFLNCLAQVNCREISDSRIGTSHFGFYFHTIALPLDPGHLPISPGVAQYANSLDILSNYLADTQPRFLSYQQGASSNWAFAYEDGSDYDYNDMVVKVESIKAVPLPGTLALLGIGLFGAGVLRRGRKVSL